MHFAVEMIGQSPVIVEARQIGATDITDLEFLMTRGPTGVGERLEVTLGLLLCDLCRADLVELGGGEADTAGLAQTGDLEQTRVNGLGQVRNGPQQLVGLPDLVRRLLQPSLRLVDPSVAVVNVLLHVPHVVVFEPVFLFFRRAQLLVLDLQ